MAAGGDVLFESRIDLVEKSVEALAADRREILEHAEHRRVGAALHGITGDAELVQQLADDELAGEDADRPGQRGRLGDDLVGRRGDVIPPRSGDIAHRHDDRLPMFARPRDLAPDRLGGDGRAARAVDAEEDRAHLGVAEGLTERAADLARAELGIVEQRG